MRVIGRLSAVTLAFVLAGCAMVTIYVTFPEEKIKKAADSIEQGLSSTGGLSVPAHVLASFFCAETYAADRDISIPSELKTDSPKIKEAVRLRSSWKDELDSYKKQGYIGENNAYQIEILKTPDEAALAKKVQALVKKENDQRKIIIDGLMEINNISPEQRNQVVEQFARSRREAAKTGEWIQNPRPDGTWEWIRKQ